MKVHVFGACTWWLALGVVAKAEPDSTSTTILTGRDQTSSAANASTSTTPSFLWSTPQSWTVCQPGKLAWVYTGPNLTASGPVSLEIAVTNDRINPTEADNGGGASNTVGLAPSRPFQSAIVTLPVNGISPTQGAYTWTKVALPPGLYKLVTTVTTVTTDSATPFVFNSSVFIVRSSPDTSCLSTTSPTLANPVNRTSPQPEPTNGNGGGSVTTSKFSKPAVIGGSIGGALVLIALVVVAFA